MDISETYIKMSGKAEEIQKLWVPTNGDFCWHDNEGEEVYGSWEYPAQVSTVNISQETPKDWWYNWLWLPRQDQLQDMVKGFESDSLTLQYKFMEWCIPYFSAKGKYIYQWYVVSKTSMEQLWLAFVMKELYNKVWGGENWKLHECLD